MDVRLPISNAQNYGANQTPNQFGGYGVQNQGFGVGNYGTQGVTQYQSAPGYQGQIQPQPQIVAADCLNAEKFACTEYAVSAMESANPSLRNTFISIQSQELNNHRRIWEYMNQRGWYQVEAAPNQMVNSVRNRTTQQVSSARQSTGFIQ